MNLDVQVMVKLIAEIQFKIICFLRQNQFKSDQQDQSSQLSLVY